MERHGTGSSEGGVGGLGEDGEAWYWQLRRRGRRSRMERHGTGSSEGGVGGLGEDGEAWYWQLRMRGRS